MAQSIIYFSDASISNQANKTITTLDNSTSGGKGYLPSIPSNAILESVILHFTCDRENGKSENEIRIQLGDSTYFTEYNLGTNDSRDVDITSIIVNNGGKLLYKNGATSLSLRGWHNLVILGKQANWTLRDIRITANYTERYTLTVVANNDGYGTVTGGGIYNNQETATLTATPNTGYKFVKWNDGYDLPTRTFTVLGDSTYIAIFEPITYYVAFDGNYAQSGSVETITAKYGQSFTLPENGFIKRASATWKANADDATLGFRASTHTFEFNGWKLKQSDAVAYQSGESTSLYPRTEGETYTFYANWADTEFSHPKATRPGYKFKEWNTESDGTGTPYTTDSFWISGWVADRASDTILYAQWERSACTITTQASPSSGGTVTGGGTYDIGTEITLIATPSDGYQFKYWIDDDGVQIWQNEVTMDAVEDYALTAYFRVNRMHLGTAQPKEMYIGETPIKEIYLGTTKIYEQ